MGTSPHRTAILLGIGLLTASCRREPVPASASAEAADTVFVVPGSHLDLGFTAPLSDVRAQRIAVLDQAMTDAERDPGFVWFEEGGWAVEAWLDHYRDQPERIAALRRLVMAGRIGVGATLLSPHAAAFPDALALLTTHLDRIERELGRRPTVAVINDVPAIPEAMVDALAGAGIRFLLGAPNLTFSAPLPLSVVKQPFYWQSSKGARVLVYLDSDGYMSASAIWGLPPECATVMNPRRFPASLGRDSILIEGVHDGLSVRGNALPLMVVQDAYDNWGPDCAERLPEAASRANALGVGATIVVATPEQYFTHLEERFGGRLPVRRGEWGGEWDLLRATEPVWSWRLREAMRQVTPATPMAARETLVEAMDHNVGLGPRWMGGLPSEVAMRHVREVATLYRSAVAGVPGAPGVDAVPPPLPSPAGGAWPATWQAIAGDRATAARVRAGGPGFLRPLIFDSAVVVPPPVDITADSARLLARVRLDRLALERRMGPRRFGVVIELRLQARRETLQLAPENSAAAIAGEWLLGVAPATVLSPDGVRVSGPGFELRADGPLIIGWSLMRDPVDPAVTWLQGLAFIDALEGDIDRGKLRRPFGVLYPGEPPVVTYDIELVRLAAPAGGGGPD